ncbi:MAG: M23 family metallopeptidase [Myxococcota bacterium]
MSRFRRIIRWLPLGTLLSMQVLVWGTLFSGGMRGVVAWLFLLSVVPLLGVLSFLGVSVYAAVRRRLSRAVVSTLAASLAAVAPGLWNFGLLTMRYPATIEELGPGATVRLPSNETLRVVWGGDRLETNYHASTPDQRWAYDLLIEPYFVESKRLEDFGCYGTQVVAPLAAKVHAVHDGEADGEPGVLAGDPSKALGNHVVLEVPQTGFLVLAHLQQGSVQVKEGEHVEEGQVLGRCGNSGNTREPHIHIHLQKQDPTRFPVNLAQGLPLFFRGHDGPPMPEGGVREEQGKPVATGAVVRHVATPRE